MRRRLVSMLAAGALLAVGPLAFHDHPGIRTVLLAAAGLGAFAALLLGARRHRPQRWALWLALGLAVAIFVLADLLRSLALLDGGHGHGHGHLVPAVYGSAYPLLAVALVLALRRLTRNVRELAFDGALVAVATTLVAWPYLFVPHLHGDTLPGMALHLLQPVGDVVVVAALGAALVSAGALVTSERLLAACLAFLLAGDVVYAASPDWGLHVAFAETLWIFAYVLLAASALHPTMPRLGDPAAARPRRSPRGRLAVVGSAALIAPALLIAEAWAGHRPASSVAVGALVLAALVVFRLALLVLESDRLRERAELSEARMLMLLDTSPIGISLPPPDDPLSGKLAITNPALQEMLGYTGRELAELDWRQVTRPGGRERNERLWEELVRGERRSYRTEGVYVRKDGTEVEAAIHVSMARASDGTPLLALGQIEDVTERRRAERELQQSEQRFRDLLGGIEAMVWECRVGDWGYTFVSGGVEQLLGYPVEQWLEDPEFWVRRIHPDDRKAVVGLARVGERDSGWVAEYRLIHADGHPVWVRDVVRVVPDEDGRPSLLRGVLVEITASKEDEAERELLRDQLRQKQKVEALGELAGGVAHDFNNLLTAMIGQVEFAQKRAGDEAAARRHLDEIRRSADRAAALTGQLLAFGRRQLLEPRVLDLNGVVLGARDLVRPLAGDAIELQVELDATAPRVLADPNQLEQVIMNLALNARDAMRRGGRLTIRTGRRCVPFEDDPGPLPPGEYAVLVVEDTGSGMPEAVARRAFDPFFTTKGPGEGTGLGLSTVFGIVSQSGGQVDLDTAPGRGTTVTVSLPLTHAAAEAEGPVAVPAVAHGAGETLLLVEDEPSVRAVVQASLEEAGYRVLVAGDGVEALERLAGHPGEVALVLSDVSMPRMGGLELAARCAAEWPEARLLLMSGYADTVPASLPLLRKPFGLEELREAVRRRLDAPAVRAPRDALQLARRDAAAPERVDLRLRERRASQALVGVQRAEQV